jgi:hypothetical protein
MREDSATTQGPYVVTTTQQRTLSSEFVVSKLAVATLDEAIAEVLRSVSRAYDGMASIHNGGRRARSDAFALPAEGGSIDLDDTTITVEPTTYGALTEALVKAGCDPVQVLTHADVLAAFNERYAAQDGRS